MADKADELEHRLLQWERPYVPCTLCCDVTQPIEHHHSFTCLIGYRHGGEGIMFFYGMAGEAAGSMLLETLLIVCRPELFRAFLTYALKGSFVEYSLHARSNFVVQATFRRLAACVSKDASFRSAAEDALKELTAGEVQS